MIRVNKMLRALAVVGVLVASTFAVSVARPVPAEAAYPHCNGWHTYGNVTLPVFYFGYAPVRDCILVLGDGSSDSAGEGTAVKALQNALILCHSGQLGSEWPGHYGPKTEAVVRWLQAVAGISADGDYGPQTRRILQWPVPDPDGWYYCVRVS